MTELVAVLTKRCCRCGGTWPASAFGRHGRTPDGLQPACKSCEVERISVWKHGMTSLEKHELAMAQGGCAICGTLEPGERGWALDHDRRCCPGDRSCELCRRGVLCAGCNRAMGYAGDDPVRLQRMADYLSAGTRLAWSREVES